MRPPALLQLPLRGTHVEGESIQRGAGQSALCLNVVEVLGQLSKFSENRLRCLTPELIANSGRDLVIYRVHGRASHIAYGPVPVSRFLVLGRLEILQRRDIHDHRSLALRVAAERIGVLIFDADFVQLSLDVRVEHPELMPRPLHQTAQVTATAAHIMDVPSPGVE